MSKKKEKKSKSRNPIAKALRSSHCSPKTHKNKKTYNRSESRRLEKEY